MKTFWFFSYIMTGWTNYCLLKETKRMIGEGGADGRASSWVPAVGIRRADGLLAVQAAGVGRLMCKWDFSNGKHFVSVV